MLMKVLLVYAVAMTPKMLAYMTICAILRAGGDTTTMRVDNNNVDIDREMAGLAKNQLYYNSLATSLGSYISRMKNAITSGQS